MKRILITGGAGFIGSKLAEEYSARGHEVVIVDKFISQVHGSASDIGTLSLKLKKISTVINGDVNDPELMERLVNDFHPEVCFHMAAETGTGQSKFESERYIATNIQGTATLLSALNKIKSFEKIILPSSRAVYGEGAYEKDGQLTYGWKRSVENMKRGMYGVYDRDNKELTPAPTPESALPTPCSLYASTKLMQEYIITQSEKSHPWKSVILRFQNVYGPGQSLCNPYTGVLSIFAEQIQKNQKLNIYEDGLISRDFVYINDVVAACMAAETSNLEDAVTLNIGSGEASYIKNVARDLLSLFGKDESCLFISGDFRDGDIRHAHADISNSKKALNWNPKVDIRTGLSEFSQWAKK